MKFLLKIKGFSVIEMMIVVAIIAILAMIAIPSSLDKIIREQVAAAVPLADAAKEPAAEIWKKEKKIADNNEALGLPTPDKVVGNFIKSTMFENGAIHMVFGNKAHKNIQDKTLSIRAAVIEESNAVPIAWVCGNAKTPDKMTVKGANKTDLAKEFLPLGCR
jgi:type IV pilus assembly protein PilA